MDDDKLEIGLKDLLNAERKKRFIEIMRRKIF